MYRLVFSAIILNLTFLPLLAGAQVLQLQSQYLNIPVTSSGAATNQGSVVDLIVEGDTYTPSFYQGRKEPSGGNSLRVIAISDNSHISNYTWLVDGKPADGVADLPNVVSFTAPLSNQVLVEVTASDANGNIIGKESRYIPLSEPQIVFYEDNPLRGYSHNAIGRTFNMIGSETSIIVAPYFIDKNDEPPQLITKWVLSGKEMATDNWRQLNLTKPEDTTRAYTIGFSLGHRTKLSLRANAFFNLGFGL